MRCTVLLSVLLMACATGGESQDLSAIHLPSADLVPVVLPDNATVLTAPEHSLSRPWALQEEDAHFILWIGAARARSAFSAASAAAASIMSTQYFFLPVATCVGATRVRAGAGSSKCKHGALLFKRSTQA